MNETVTEAADNLVEAAKITATAPKPDWEAYRQVCLLVAEQVFEAGKRPITWVKPEIITP